MKLLWCCLLLLIGAGDCLWAQQPAITPETPASTALLHEWLSSGDPRLIAWAAYCARRNHDARIVQEIPPLIEHAPMPPAYGRTQTQAAQRRSLLALLDTLIEEHASVPVSTLDAISEGFPEQTAILAEHQPLQDTHALFARWTGEDQAILPRPWSRKDEANGRGWPHALLARIATMTLAPKPSSHLVRLVLENSEHELTIHVAQKQTNYGQGGTASCGDSFGTPPTPGWPEIYTYTLEEFSSMQPLQNANHTVLLDLDGDRIVFVRHKEKAGWGSCYGVENLNAVTRHRLIAYWLGTDAKAMSWQPAESATIRWNGQKDYERKLGHLVEEHRQRMAATVNTLVQRGLLKEKESKQAFPRFELNIECEIAPCPISKKTE